MQAKIFLVIKDQKLKIFDWEKNKNQFALGLQMKIVHLRTNFKSWTVYGNLENLACFRSKRGFTFSSRMESVLQTSKLSTKGTIASMKILVEQFALFLKGKSYSSSN